MAEETAIGKPLEVYVSKTEAQLLEGEPNVLGLSSDQNTIVFNNKVIGSGAGIRYKKIQLSAGQRWIRFAVANSGAERQPTVVFGIDRGYSSSKDEHYIFASTLSHQKKGYITQLTGTYDDTKNHFIKKVRTAQSKSNVKPFYLDFYVDSTSTETYYVWVLGYWDLLDLSVVDEQQDATDNITRYVEFETSNGFNLDNNSLQIFRDKILSGLTEATADIRDTTFISTSDATGETGKWYKRKATTFWNYIKAKLGTVGSLGVGTTTPTAMLEVNGEIKAKGIDASLYHYINETTGYHHYVYLLGKVKMGGGNYTAVGKLFFRQQGVDRFGSYDVAIHVSNNLVSSTWSETSFYLLNTGNDSTAAFDLVQCTYEGEEYWALRLSGIQARGVYFSGYYKNVLWMPISYYNANTKEILNEEIYNSIIEKNDLLKRPNINGNEVVLKNDVDISSNIMRFQGVLDVEPTYASSGVSSWNYITFVKPLNKFVAVNSSTLPPTYHQAFNNGEVSQDAYNNNPNVLFIDNITGETYTWHGDTNETFSKISGTKEYTTEVISIDANFNVTCLSNNAISTLPTNILNGVMYLKSNGAVKSTAIPLNLGITTNYPIKYLNGTTWIDATILVRANAITAQWFLYVPSDTSVSTEGLVLEGQITANFVEE